MTLSPGTRLGPYEVLEQLGAGGMGVVYKGRDPRLGREVAIKVLAPTFAADQDRLRRFEQEARAAGSLNHPNILTVFDVGSHESGPYLVTELLQGETLRLRLAAGALPPPQALDIGRQIAEGLAAAHAKGIVHRDLKPENLFLSQDGRVKILDFGLAKLVRSPLTAAEASGTIPAGASDSGSISGTAGYMSPEQVRGEPVDHRSDVFALGAIIHESLSGIRIFSKESVFGTLDAIVKEDPPPLTPELLAKYPALEKVLGRCLEKSPERRFQSAADLAFVLGIESGQRLKTTETRTSPTVGAPVPAFRRLTYRRGSIFNARFAADGSTVVYSGRYEGKPPEVFTVQMGFPESRPLGLEGTELLSVSRHGELAVGLEYRHLGAFVSSGVLARVPMGVGSPRELEENIFLAEWGPGGDDLIVVREVAGTMRIEYPLGHVLYETAGWVGGIRLSPDGTQIAFIDHPLRGNDEGTIDLLSLDGKHKVLSTGWKSIWGISWTPEGKEILFGGSQLPFGRDIQAASLDGRHRVVLQSPGSLTMLDISQKGDILFTRGTERMGIMARAAGDTSERELSWLDWSLLRDMSPDGRWIAFDESGEGAVNTPTVYMRRTDGSPAVRLGPGLAMQFSSDRKWVLSVNEEHRITLTPTGTGASRTYSLGPIQCHFAKWFPDESRIMFSGNEPGGSFRAFALDPQTGAIEPLTQEGVQLEVFVAPDGKHLVFPGPTRNYCLFPIGGGPAKPFPHMKPDDRPALFTKDGKSVYLYQRGVVPTRLERLDVDTGQRELIQELRPPELAGVFSISPVRVTEDGSAYAYSFSSLLHDLYIARGFI